MVLAGSQDFVFTVIGGIVFSIGELAVLHLYISRAVKRLRNAESDRDRASVKREINVEAINFHGDVVLEVYMCIISMVGLFLFRESTVLVGFGAAGKYLDSIPKMVATIAAQLGPDALGDAIAFSVLRCHRLNVVQYSQQMTVRDYVTKSLCSLCLACTFLVMSIDR